MRVFVFLLFSFTNYLSFGQITLKSVLVDSATREPVAFAHIVLEGTYMGVTSDIDGRFSIGIPDRYTKRVVISHVGYHTRSFLPEELQNQKTISLRSKTSQLHEVVVHAGENPALKIIRKATSNKENNNPLALQSFQYTSYNKTVFKFEGPVLNIDSVKQRAVEKPLTKNDSSTLALDQFRNKQHFFMTESVAEKFYSQPQKHFERLLDYRITGFETPLMAGLPNDYQPLGFYDDWIKLLNKDHRSPLTKASEKVYYFELMDTLIQERDSVFVIAFAPLKGTSADLLQGQLSISTQGYAIKNVIAKSADPYAKIDFRIQQNYDNIDGRWFPVQLNTELYFTESKTAHLYPVALARSYLANIKINPRIPATTFGAVQVDMSPRAQSGLLDSLRVGNYDSLEIRTYTWYDSMKQKLKVFTTIDKLVEGLFSNVLTTGAIDWQLNRILRVNEYEGARVGVGLSTNPTFSKWVNVGGYVGYGFKDESWKYGGNLQLILHEPSTLSTDLRYKYDIQEPGVHRFFENQRMVSNSTFRQWVGSRFDGIESYRIALSIKAGPSWRMLAGLEKSTLSPRYAYTFTVGEKTFSSFSITEATGEISYIHKLREIGFAGRKAMLEFQQPLFFLRASKAINAFKGQFDYTRIELFFTDKFRFRRLGTTQLSAIAGLTVGEAPLQKLYFTPGNAETNYWTDHTFQTMGIYEFLNDRYTSLFWRHNAGWLYQTKISKPELLLWQAAGWGSLKNTSGHQGVLVKRIDKGYYESGIGLNNLLRFNYVDVAYIGLGGGAFYRWGDYQFPQQKDNFAYKLNITLTF